MVSAFGIWASVANLIGVVVLLMLLPALAVLSLKPASIASGQDHLGAGNATPLLELLCSKIGIFTLKRSYVIAVVGICITIALTAVYAQLSPLYRLSDQLPADSSFRRVNATLDAHFSGSNRIAIVISQQFGETASPVRLLDAVKEAHLRLAAIDGLSEPLSILSLLGSKPPLSWPSSERLSQWISAIPASKTKGLLNHVDGVAILLVDVPDLESGEIKRIVQTIERRIHATSQMFADHQFTVTGMPVLLAKEAPKIVRQINVSLAAALVLVFGVIGLAFRSFKTAVVSVVPNVLPIAAAGTFVYLMVGGLDYASVIGLTVAFGLAVDDSIHYLNRVMAMSEERSPTDQSILGAIRSTGPVLIATTAILFSTLAITVFGSLPPTQIFGQTCAAMLVAALLADLFILPALTRVIFVTD
jgi:predicted RND superfamily exporter protein